MDLLGNIIGLSGHIPMVPSNPAHKLGLIAQDHVLKYLNAWIRVPHAPD